MGAGSGVVFIGKSRGICMAIGKEKPSLEEILYLGFFIILSVTKGLGFYEGQKLFTLLVVPAFVCALFKILISSYTKRQWFMQSILLLMAAVVYYESGTVGIFFVLFMILGMKNISVKKVFRAGLWVWSLCAIVLSVFSFFRLEHTTYRVHAKMGLGHIFRWSLGFTHPNILHITYLALCAFILYELAERYHFKHFVLLMIGNGLVFFYSISYTGFGIVAALLIGELYVKFRPKFSLMEKAVVNLTLPVCLFFSFVLPQIIFIKKYAAVVQKLNFLLNTRIWLAKQYLVPEYTSLFGVRFSEKAQAFLSIDNSYIWGFVNYGIIPFSLFMAAYLILIVDYSRKQKVRELVIIICFLGAGFTEQLLFNTSFKNITLLFLGEFIFRQKEGAEEYCLCPALRRKMERQYEKLLLKISQQKWIQWNLPQKIATVIHSCRRQIAAGVFAGAVIGAVLCGVLRTEPKGYIVQRFYTDGMYDASVYLESKNDAAYEGYRVMNYVDAETPMQIVDGNAVRLETARYYVGSVLIGGLGGYLICTGYFLRKKVKKSKIF